MTQAVQGCRVDKSRKGGCLWHLLAGRSLNAKKGRRAEGRAGEQGRGEAGEGRRAGKKRRAGEEGRAKGYVPQRTPIWRFNAVVFKVCDHGP